MQFWHHAMLVKRVQLIQTETLALNYSKYIQTSQVDYHTQFRDWCINACRKCLQNASDLKQLFTHKRIYIKMVLYNMYTKSV